MVERVEMVPGTALPYGGGPDATEQEEGRGVPLLRAPRGESIFDRLGDPAGLSEMERHVIAAALRAYDLAPKRERPIFQTAAGESDATTGNLVLPLFTVPQGWYGAVSQVVADVPSSASVNPSAPLANAAIWAFIASVSPVGLGWTAGLNAQADNFRIGILDFLPVSAGGPTIPGKWTYGDDNGPIVWGGEQLIYVLHGGSIAAAKSLLVQVNYRVNLYSVGAV